MLRTDEKYMEKNTDDDRQQPNNPYVVCIHHGTDLDGWTSAALVQRWAEDNGLMPFFFPMNHDAPVRCREIIENFRPRYFIVADYSLTPDEFRELLDARNDLGEPCDFLWCDHHISAARDWNKAGYISDNDMRAFERGEQIMISVPGTHHDEALLSQEEIRLPPPARNAVPGRNATALCLLRRQIRRMGHGSGYPA